MILEIVSLVIFSISAFVHLFFSLGCLGLATVRESWETNKSSIMPHRYTEFIWLIIYGWLGALIIVSIVIPVKFFEVIGIFLCIFFILDIIWVISHCDNRIHVGVIIRILQFVVCILCQFILHTGYFKSFTWIGENNEAIKLMLLLIPISITTGWILITLVFNIFALGYIKEESEGKMGSLVFFALIIFSGGVLILTGDVFIVLVFMWAFVGVYFNSGDNTFIRGISSVSVLLICLMNGLYFFIDYIPTLFI